MLNWLDRFFGKVSGAIGAEISKAVHWAFHALASVVFAVFGLVGKAWALFVRGVHDFMAAIDKLGAEIIAFASWLVHVEIPAILRWAGAELAKLSSALANIYDWAVKAIADVIRRIEAAISDVTKWVLRNVWDPLKAYADKIYNDLLKWGFYAYNVLTHPQALADSLLLFLVNSLERAAWDIGQKLGTFLLALISANIKKLLILIEDIVTAVF
jgi:hypothetical protein